MNDKNKTKDKTAGIILYIGGDSPFYENIKENFRKLYPSITVEFEQLYSTDDKVIQSYMNKITEIKPKLLVLDFSQNEKGMLHLARLWQRQNFYYSIPVVGLCDFNQGQNFVIKAIMTKIACIHIKSLEYESLIYNMVLLGFNKFTENHGFAMAKLSDMIHSYQVCKINLINENFFKIESDFQMKPKQVLRLTNFWDRNNIVKSNLMMCVDQSQKNIYYNFKYTQVLQMAHAEPVEATDDMSPEEFEEKQQKRQELVEESRYKLRKWINENELNSRPKLLKCYVIDKSGTFFDMKPMTDLYNYVLRIQPFMENTKKELTNHNPQLIIYNLEYIDKETLEANSDIAHTYNDSRMFQHLVKTAKDIFKDNVPLVIVFNSGQYDTNYMQKVFSYPNLIAVKEEMTYPHAIKLMKMLESKITPHLQPPNKGDVYIDKNLEASYGEIELDISLVACSENDIYFSSEEELKVGTVLRVSLPVPMYITIMPIPDFSKAVGYYYGFIHGIGEVERKRLRRFINSVFFRGLDNAKQEDMAQVTKKKEEYIAKQKAAEEERRKMIEAAKEQNNSEDAE